MNIKISNLGFYLPEKIETSKQLAEKIGKSEDWIISRTGVKERRVSIIDVDEMGAKAVQSMGDLKKPNLIINASGVGKQVLPDTSVFIQKVLGWSGIPSFSIHSTCLSFMTALVNASGLLSAGLYDRILIVSSERGTKGRNFNEPESASLLGDAAACVIVENDNLTKSKINYWSMSTWPEGANLTEVRGGGTARHPHDSITTFNDNLFHMKGPKVYRMARKKVYKLISQILVENELTQEDIDLVIPHQASGSAVQAYVKYGGFPKEKVVDIISNTGNCVAASIPLAMAISHDNGQLKRGHKVLVIGTGAGLSAAGMLLTF
ncbi:MAG: 3-oxoacyl-ACP synthase [Candidatus Marinimicrobia bacterium]|nr:3-oxoacyl-ACP synthase [Candidatus Neomarinimicrobiota bacterium]|tara:strand:- start:1697 stop:2656 length:960 start_codon:yes stop_codon:yes gene_type:complete